MMKRLAIFLVAFGSCWAQDNAKIESIGLFKNGLAVVRVADEIPDSGKLEITSLLQPVHGTFWIRSENPVTAKVALKKVETSTGILSHNVLLQSLAGKQVTIHLDNEVIRGEVVGETQEEQKSWSRDYASTGGATHNWGSYHPLQQIPASLALIKTETGITAVNPETARRIEFDEAPTITREQPVLELNSDGAGDVEINYLTKGISWAPSYRIDLSHDDELVISQKAVIHNELSDLQEVEFELISGFPSVRFAAVDSPLSPKQTWTNFFQQLQNSASNQVQTSLANNAVYAQVGHGGHQPNVGGAALGPADQGESVDLHYESIGRHSLAPGESLTVEVASDEAKYERVVEWNIPDTRSPNGQYIQEYQRQQNPGKYDESAWDAIVFRNPFDFPMTTAPAMLVRNGHFQGQQTSTWTNPGAETTVKVTKALSISTRSVEHEIPDTRVNVDVAGNDYYKVQVRGELTMESHRGKPATILIKRQFSGELLEAEEDPSQQLLEAGVYSINKRNELRWRVELPEGEEKVIKYRYSVLVDH